MENLKKLIHQRGQVKARVTTIVRKLTEATNFPEVVSLSQLKALERKLEMHYAEYSAKHDLIMALCPTESVEDQDKKLDDFDELHTDALVKLNQLMEVFRAEPVNNRAPQVIVTQQPLSTPIPTFDGTYEGWPKFKALFNDLVGKCGDSDATKLQYLDKALIGDASGILDARIINDNNYDQAWQLLEERFENPRVIIDTHISGLLSMKPIFKQSYKELRSLIDTCNRHVEGLRFMKQEVDGTAGLIVVKLLTMCLDGETRKQWEMTLDHGELPDLDDSMKFLRNYCQVLERCEMDRVPSTKPSPMMKSSLSPRTSYPATTSSIGSECGICAGRHSSCKCPSFLSMSVDQRVSMVKRDGLCFNCLWKGHQVRDCQAEESCSKCNRRHHTMLHFDEVSHREPSEQPEVQTAEASDVIEEPVSTACSSIHQRSKHVFLMTALVNVTSKSGRVYKLRALLDSGSQVSLVSESAVKLLGLPSSPTSVPVVGVGGVKSQIRQRVNLKISSSYSQFERDLNCLVTTKVTGRIPPVPVSISEWKIPTGIVLADPKFNDPRAVDLLIGAELFSQILRQAQMRLSDNLPTMYETQFGWVITGALEEFEDEAVHVMCATNESPLRERFRRFSEEEETPEQRMSAGEEREIADHLFNAGLRDEIGRTVIQLPCDESVDQLGDSEPSVTSCFVPSGNDQAMQPLIEENCQAFVRGFEDVDYEVRERDVISRPNSLLSRIVLEPESTNEKFNFVLDSEAKTGEVSATEVLVIGRKANPDRKQKKLDQMEYCGGDVRVSGAFWDQERDRFLLWKVPKSVKLYKGALFKMLKLDLLPEIVSAISSSQQPWMNEIGWCGVFDDEQFYRSPMRLRKRDDELWSKSRVVLAWMKESPDQLHKGSCAVETVKPTSVNRRNCRQYKIGDVEESVFGESEERNDSRRIFKQGVKVFCKVICCNELRADLSLSLFSRAKWTISESKVILGTIVLVMKDIQTVQSWRLGRIVALYHGLQWAFSDAQPESWNPVPSTIITSQLLEWHSNRREYVRAQRVQATVIRVPCCYPYKYHLDNDRETLSSSCAFQMGGANSVAQQASTAKC